MRDDFNRKIEWIAEITILYQTNVVPREFYNLGRED